MQAHDEHARSADAVRDKAAVACVRREAWWRAQNGALPRLDSGEEHRAAYALDREGAVVDVGRALD